MVGYIHLAELAVNELKTNFSLTNSHSKCDSQNASPLSKPTRTPTRRQSTPSGPLSLRASIVYEHITVELIDEGVGGSYFLKQGFKTIGVFKPSDEEPGAYNNPKGYIEESENDKGNIKPGQCWRREIATYLLDHNHISGVPETIDLKLPNKLFAKKDLENHCKIGSLQAFIENWDGSHCVSSCDMGPSSFPTEDVHHIGLLDLRLLNSDRHGGNILVQKLEKGGLHLIPIDHSFVLPHNLQDLDFEWLFWPQSRVPFSSSTLEYISKLDPDNDAKILTELEIPWECIELMKAATICIKIAAYEYHLSLRTIGDFMRRDKMYEMSSMEAVISESRLPLEMGADIEWDKLRLLLHEKLSELTETKPTKTIIIEKGIKQKVLDSGVRAQLTDEGEGGTYVVLDEEGHPIAIFKPSDEEPWCKFNPRGLTNENEGLKGGISPGKGYLREIAAYKLDHHGWAGVPETLEMSIPSSWFPQSTRRDGILNKNGSLQCYIDSPYSPLQASWDLGPSVFSVNDVHRIGILDIRLCNSDRHGGNLLFRRDKTGGRLFPIDHAYVLPLNLADLEFEWLTWPQSKIQFSVDELRYIRDLDALSDAQILEDLGIESEAIEIFIVSTFTLQAAASLGFTLRDTGRFFRRETLYEDSALEQLIGNSRKPIDDGGTVDIEKLKQILPSKLREFQKILYPENDDG
eukprot:NODE_717_length_2424_cov_35.826597_g616_i0.p1 GENE.NODE_717_length_2424_cov_35.826597_g616_i0~~NODE_717_length_2424_cov_35.826597_g616_i0.p1  ORF type:complete len:689 (-),score=106.40 NODE_717_length_2424_cov_35.826597_g616_i0:248-2314(-)